ncbi:right-handed parallel beta-helix repeat-containing protein [Kribbella sp. NBC_01484]|uniref:right-handed parallel beta-helix repeat-containing protein n=1 Tax=Kribbella sp. NBC_01484 TaxID=2903579 RepID=UPI002E2FF958|nr:right-handed parallel beta-helix repeat-containing protein [Kribbella sp. NBC_01484]
MSEARDGSRALAAATTLAVVIAGTVIAMVAPAQAGAVAAATAVKTTLHCGDTITADTKLHADLVNCPGDGIVIGADNITLDLNGHTIDGDGVRSECPDGPCDIGVSNLDGHDRVTVTGGKVRQFRAGAFVGGGAAHNRLRQLVIADTNDAGVILADTTDSTIESNVVRGNDEGIGIFDSSRNAVRGNAVSHNAGAAMDIGGSATANRVEHNRLAANGDGIVLQEVDGNLISHNLVTGTGFFGSAETGGFGIILDGANRNTVDRNTVTGGRGPAILVLTLDAPNAPEDNIISRNTVNSVESEGIYVGTTAIATVVERNTANRNGNDGIHVDGPSTKLTRNTANNNHNLGIEAVPGVIDGGGNHASHNGNPAQCTNVAC